MPALPSALQRRGIREDVVELRHAVDDALRIAHEALHRVQQQQRERPHGLNEDALHERLCAFETFIIRRIREVTARAPAPDIHYVDTGKGQDDANAPTASSTSGAPTTAALLGHKVELQLEAQRTRSTAMEQRLGQMESKLNALMTDVVTQSQREAAHHKQLTSMLHEQVDAELRSAVASLENFARQKEEDGRLASSRAPPDVVDVSVMHHVATALTAMHERVEEQHLQLTQWQQQQYALMDAVVKQMNGLKSENAELRQELFRLRNHTSQSADADEGHERENDDDAPVVWARQTAA
ncbi:hypothetical protein ABL78_0174 [Leptomonas seymouri]|uniref:Uncharacterized protein n=1 Tax=Leptomonas seymouri TaxID=5684 RepID=A0A0N1I2E9_LEPSE|nr:hypothetical protein ABL78_0174 [Leptomonas seymouri]|eukprot:KPI90738.1 hypothetical protein ABL78_0174 [Leptomonas seymouri]